MEISSTCLSIAQYLIVLDVESAKCSLSPIFSSQLFEMGHRLRRGLAPVGVKEHKNIIVLRKFCPNQLQNLMLPVLALRGSLTLEVGSQIVVQETLDELLKLRSLLVLDSIFLAALAVDHG